MIFIPACLYGSTTKETRLQLQLLLLPVSFVVVRHTTVAFPPCFPFLGFFLLAVLLATSYRDLSCKALSEAPSTTVYVSCF